MCPVQALTATFRAELRKFDRERALPAWDGLVTKQQTALEGWGAPTMFPTALQPDREVSAACSCPWTLALCEKKFMFELLYASCACPTGAIPSRDRLPCLFGGRPGVFPFVVCSR